MENGNFRSQEGKIFQIVKRRANMSLREIQRAYEKRYKQRIELSSVSARVNFMKGLGIFKEDPPRKCSVTHNTVIVVHV
jgi:hypothetical protein